MANRTCQHLGLVANFLLDNWLLVNYDNRVWIDHGILVAWVRLNLSLLCLHLVMILVENLVNALKKFTHFLLRLNLIPC